MLPQMQPLSPFLTTIPPFRTQQVWKTMWRDFGGGREAADVDSAATAAREFAEETLVRAAGSGSCDWQFVVLARVL